MSSEAMNAEERLEHSGFKWLTVATLMFFFVYVMIHIGLNLTAQGTSTVKLQLEVSKQLSSREDIKLALNQKNKSETNQTQNNQSNLQKEKISAFEKFLLDNSGPITISICSSLLIFSFGTFLLHGLKHLSVSAPYAFLNAFLIFIYGQILVQIGGHAEIYVDNQRAASQSVHWAFNLLSMVSYPFAFASLYYLERYVERVYGALSPQLPEDQRREEGHARNMGYVTIISIVLLIIKPLVLGLDKDSKFGVTFLLLLAEMALALFVYLQARNRDHNRKPRFVKNQQ